MRIRKQLDLIAVIGITFFALILNLISSEPLKLLRYIVALPVLFFIPGYVLLSAINPRQFKSFSNLISSLETVVFSLGFSIIIIVLLGALLIFTPIRFTAQSAIWTIVIFIFIFSCIALYRRWQTHEKFIPKPAKQPVKQFDLKFNFASPANKLVIILLAITLSTGGFIAFYILTNLPHQPETRFYLLGANRTLDLPSKLKLGDNLTVVVGVINDNPAELEFNLVGRLGNHTIFQKNFTLMQNEQREFEITFNITTPGRHKLDFALYQNGVIVGNVHCWLEITATETQVIVERHIFA